jgi:hypothetical protein
MHYLGIFLTIGLCFKKKTWKFFFFVESTRTYRYVWDLKKYFLTNFVLQPKLWYLPFRGLLIQGAEIQ